MCVIRHFIPGFLNDIDPFFLGIIGVLLDEIDHVIFDKTKIGDIFKQLRIRIAFDIFLGDCLSDTLNIYFIKPRLL